MRHILLAACAVAWLSSTAFAQTISTPASVDCASIATNRIEPIVARFPDGGVALANAIATAVEADPSLAGDAQALTSKVTPAQKAAITAGLAQAVAYFKRTNYPIGVAAIQASQASCGVCAGLAINRIEPIVAQYPNGGGTLANAIATAVEADASLARDAAAITNKVTQDQKLAIAAGLAQAAAFFKRNNNATGLERVQAALPCADALTRSAFAAASSSLFADQNGQGGDNSQGNNGGSFSSGAGTGSAGVGGSIVD